MTEEEVKLNYITPAIENAGWIKKQINVPLIRMYSGEIRKLTPREYFNLQGYPADYNLPTNLSKSSLYKQAGNSVVVTVIERITENILKAVR